MKKLHVSKYLFFALSVVIALSMLLAACAPPATPAPVEPVATEAPAEPVATEAPAEPVATEAPAEPVATEAPVVTEAPAAEAPVADKTLTIAVSGDIAGWDPVTSIYWLANEIIINTHDTLVDYGPATDEAGNAVRDFSKVVPNLAESWEEKDGKEFTFKIRDNAFFRNGDPVTAQAVKDNFARVLEIPSLASFLLADVAFVKSPDQMEVIDDKTIKFTLENPNPMFLKVMQEMNMAIVNINELKTKGGETQEEMTKYVSENTTGSGPYYVDKYEPGVELVLKVNDKYWGEKPYYEEVVYKVVTDVQNRELLLKNGDVDVIYEAPAKDFESLKSDPNIQAFATPTLGTLFYWVGSNMEPWSNPDLVQALGYAVPYDTIINDVTYGLAKPATSWIPVGLEGHIPTKEFTYDLEKAKELLAKAGYPDGKGLPPVTFYSKQGVPEEEEAAVYIQAELAKLGIQMDIQPIALAAHSEKVSSHEPGFFGFNFWIPYVPDPVYSLYWTFKTAESGCCNYASYSNPEVDALIEKGLYELDPAVRNGYVEEAQKIIASAPPNIPVYHPAWIIAMLKGIQGYSYYPDTLLRFAQMSESQ